MEFEREGVLASVECTETPVCLRSLISSEAEDEGVDEELQWPKVSSIEGKSTEEATSEEISTEGEVGSVFEAHLTLAFVEEELQIGGFVEWAEEVALKAADDGRSNLLLTKTRSTKSSICI